MFERFHRGRDADRSDGAGLGLSIVEAIARAHRGRVELDSRVGEGSVFTIVVPRARAGAGERRMSCPTSTSRIRTFLGEGRT